MSLRARNGDVSAHMVACLSLHCLSVAVRVRAMAARAKALRLCLSPIESSGMCVSLMVHDSAGGARLFGETANLVDIDK